MESQDDIDMHELLYDIVCSYSCTSYSNRLLKGKLHRVREVITGSKLHKRYVFNQQNILASYSYTAVHS